MRRREHWPLLLGFCLGSMAWNVAWPFLPLRVQAAGVGDLTEVARLSGLLAGGSNLVTALLGPLWSALGERFGYRWQILRAHVGTGLSMGALGLARTPLELAGAGVMLGTLGGNYPHYVALAASRAAPAEVGRVIGELQAAGQLGATIGPLIGGLVASQLEVSASFLLTGLISWSGGLMIALTVRPDGGLAGRGGRSSAG
jgi:DHA1 family multidrug resistance protein-like MFS transporter